MQNSSTRICAWRLISPDRRVYIWNSILLLPQKERFSANCTFCKDHKHTQKRASYSLFDWVMGLYSSNLQTRISWCFADDFLFALPGGSWWVQLNTHICIMCAPQSLWYLRTFAIQWGIAQCTVEKGNEKKPNQHSQKRMIIIRFFFRSESAFFFYFAGLGISSPLCVMCIMRFCGLVANQRWGDWWRNGQFAFLCFLFDFFFEWLCAFVVNEFFLRLTASLNQRKWLGNTFVYWWLICEWFVLLFWNRY